MKCEEDISQVLSLKARWPCAKIIKLASYTLINQSLSVPPHCFIFATKSKVSCLGWWLVSLNIVRVVSRSCYFTGFSPSLYFSEFEEATILALLYGRWHEESSVDTIRHLVQYHVIPQCNSHSHCFLYPTQDQASSVRVESKQMNNGVRPRPDVTLLITMGRLDWWTQ